MSPNFSPPPVSKRIVLLLFLVSAFSFVYLKHFLNESNPANRVALCLALLDNGSVCIDKYYHYSVDHCIRDGHYYCDKAPGVSFLALPFIAAAYHGLQAIGKTDFTSFDPVRKEEPNPNFKFLLLVGSIPVSLFGALAISMFYALAVRLGASQRVAVFGALLLGFGTPFGVWCTVMFGHAIAGAFLLFATAIGWRLLQTERPEGCRIAWTVSGFLLAYAVWIEYTAAIPSIIIGCIFLAAMIRKQFTARRIFPVVCFLGAGAIPVAVGFFLYNTWAFGGPFTLGYQFDTTNFPLMGEGFCGIKVPRPDVLFQTIFSTKHGILWYSPILFLSPLLALRNIFRNDKRELNVACLLIPLYYYLLNSSYVYWMQSDVPCRHTTASLPFLVLPLIVGFGTLPPLVRRLVGALATYSFVMCVVAMNVPGSATLMRAEIKPLFLLREFAGGGIRNLPYYIGLNPLLTLGVLLVVWGVFSVLLIATVRNVERSSVPDTGSDDL